MNGLECDVGRDFLQLHHGFHREVGVAVQPGGNGAAELFYFSAGDLHIAGVGSGFVDQDFSELEDDLFGGAFADAFDAFQCGEIAEADGLLDVFDASGREDGERGFWDRRR